MKMYAITDINDKVWSLLDKRWIELDPLFSKGVEQYLMRREDLYNALIDIKKYETFAGVYQLHTFELQSTDTTGYMTAIMMQEKFINEGL